MTPFCIPPRFAEHMKQAAKAGYITMEKLYGMSSGERRELFGKYVGREMAKEVNTGFENAMASDQHSAIGKWVKATFSSGEKATPAYKDILTKINSLNEKGLLTPESEKAFLEDLVAEKLGVKVTTEEATKITEYAKQLNDLQSHLSGLGDPTENSEGQIAYLKEKEKLNNYVASLTPSSNLKVFTSSIGRGMMIATLHSPVLNVISHAAISALEIPGRRIAGLNFRTLNNDFARKYMSHANQVYDKTGYDLSRFEEFGREKRALGEEYTHSQGKGPIRFTGRVVEDLIYKNLHGNIYERFAAAHFADSANLKTTALAKAEGLRGIAQKERALEIFKDAVRTEPQTEIGRMVRAQAQADALYSTFTNKSAASKAALGIRKVVNTGTGDFRLGDLEIPFAKIPANVLQSQLNASGIFLAPDVVTRMIKTLNDMHHGVPFTEATKQGFAGLNQTLTRAGMGITFAYLVSTLIQPQDFIGAYPTSPTEQKLLSERNGVANSIKIGGKWISLDYLGPLGSSLLGWLYAKKYGAQTPLDFIYRYGQGTTAPLQNLPGLKEIASVYKYLNTPPSQKTDVKAFATTEGKTILGQLTSRIIPGFISDIAKMTDSYNRSVDKNSIFAQVQSSIPGLREGLPIAKNLFGDKQKTEPWLSTLLFGARVKSGSDSQLLNELVRLDQQNELPSITDVSKNSKAMGQLKTQIGEQKFNQALEYFGKNLKQNMLDTIHSDDYKSADSALVQKQMLDKTKSQTLKDTLDTYGYEKP